MHGVGAVSAPLSTDSLSKSYTCQTEAPGLNFSLRSSFSGTKKDIREKWRQMKDDEKSRFVHVSARERAGEILGGRAETDTSSSMVDAAMRSESEVSLARKRKRSDQSNSNNRMKSTERTTASGSVSPNLESSMQPGVRSRKAAQRPAPTAFKRKSTALWRWSGLEGRLERALSETIYLLSRSDYFTFVVMGQTGNVYRVKFVLEDEGHGGEERSGTTSKGGKRGRKKGIGDCITCTCPDARRGSRGRSRLCKHRIFVLVKVLGIEPQELEYLVVDRGVVDAMLTNAPDTEDSSVTDSWASKRYKELMSGDTTLRVTRKAADGPCPICFEDMEEEEEVVQGVEGKEGSSKSYRGQGKERANSRSGKEGALVYCDYSCGQPVHSDCFRRWKNSRKADIVCCVMCRSVWVEDEAALKHMRAGQGEFLNLYDHERLV